MALLTWRRVCWVAGVLVVAPVAGFAQGTGARNGRLLVTVVDPSGAVVPGATVTLAGLENATRAIALQPATTSDQGIATVQGLVPGRYSLQGEFQGFDVGVVGEVRIRAGDNRQVIVLPLKKVEDSVTVGPGKEAAASTRANATFGVGLSATEVEALSDDATELTRQLSELGGADAIIRVDSFEGQQLPPKAQIKAVHVTRDQFAAETEQPGSTFVDVITQPGVGPVRGGGNFSFRDGAMSARNPFVPTKGDEQLKLYGFNIGGALVREKSNFSLSVNGRDEYSTPNLNVALPSGTQSRALILRQPNKNLNVNGLLDYALTRDQTLRFGVSQVTNTAGNLGIGAYDFPERAYSNDFHFFSLRMLEAGPIGRRTFINTRVNLMWSDFSAHSATELPTLIVQDSFTRGGAQQAGGNHNRNFLIASDVDHVRGRHSWRAGIQVQGGRARSDTDQNYLGTFTFSSNDAFEAGQPQLFTRHVGDPVVSYFNAQTGIYVQDDIRLRKNLTLSPGVRYSVQTHVADYSALAPRFGVTWSPYASGRTTLRASAGTFNFWLPMFVYEQTLRLDGTHQQEQVIVNPSYPDPGIVGEVPPTSKYLLGDFKLQNNLRYSVGIDQVLSPRIRVNVLYNYIHLFQQPRGRNLNAPVDGVRPDPTFANVIESVTDTEIRRHELYVNLNLTLVAPSPAVTRDRFNWRRVALTGAYSKIRARNNSAGAFAVPPSGSVDTEWGPGPADMPYRVNLALISTQLRDVTLNVNWNASDGFPYTWTTGFDDNQDGLLNDRPAGVPLRSLRTAPQSTLNARATYALPLGASAAPGSSTPRYRLSMFVNVTNVINRPNLSGYSGVGTSPFFQQATTVNNPRRVDMGVSMTF